MLEEGSFQSRYNKHFDPARVVPKREIPAMAEWSNLKRAFMAPAVSTAKASVIKATGKVSITVCCVTECPRTGTRKKHNPQTFIQHITMCLAPPQGKMETRKGKISPFSQKMHTRVEENK